MCGRHGSRLPSWPLQSSMLATAWQGDQRGCQEACPQERLSAAGCPVDWAAQESLSPRSPACCALSAGVSHVLCFPSCQRQVDTLSEAQWDIVPPPSSMHF